MPSHRIHQLNDLIREIIADILLTRINRDFFRLLTVTRAIVNPDLSQAKIFISIPDKKYPRFEAWLKKEIYGIQGEFNRRISLRKLPRLIFVEDVTGEYVDRIDELLRKAKGGS